MQHPAPVRSPKQVWCPSWDISASPLGWVKHPQTCSTSSTLTSPAAGLTFGMGAASRAQGRALGAALGPCGATHLEQRPGRERDPALIPLLGHPGRRNTTLVGLESRRADLSLRGRGGTGRKSGSIWLKGVILSLFRCLVLFQMRVKEGGTSLSPKESREGCAGDSPGLQPAAKPRLCPATRLTKEPFKRGDDVNSAISRGKEKRAEGRLLPPAVAS